MLFPLRRCLPNKFLHQWLVRWHVPRPTGRHVAHSLARDVPSHPWQLPSWGPEPDRLAVPDSEDRSPVAANSVSTSGTCSRFDLPMPCRLWCYDRLSLFQRSHRRIKSTSLMDKGQRVCNQPTTTKTNRSREVVIINKQNNSLAARASYRIMLQDVHES
jgi:hypothetical protein